MIFLVTGFQVMSYQRMICTNCGKRYVTCAHEVYLPLHCEVCASDQIDFLDLVAPLLEKEIASKVQRRGIP